MILLGPARFLYTDTGSNLTLTQILVLVYSSDVSSGRIIINGDIGFLSGDRQPRYLQDVEEVIKGHGIP